MTSKKQLLKALLSNRKLYAYVAWNSDSGGYVQIIKSDFFKTVKESPDDENYFTNVSIDDDSIYIN